MFSCRHENIWELAPQNIRKIREEQTYSAKNQMKRIKYFILALSLMLTGVPITAFAAENAAPEADTVEESQASDGSDSLNDAESSDAQETQETELVPTLLETDKVSTDDILLYSSSCVVMDTQSGAILYSKNRSDRHYPASITKILTTLLALERTQLTDNVTFSEEAVYSINWWESSNMELQPGDELTMEQALYGIMLQSANEAAYGVAEYVSGSVEAFAQDMNDYAKSLGCHFTHFTNASGLHDDDHYTTAKDMAIIASAAAQNEEFRKIAGTVTYSVENINYKAMVPETEETQTDESDDETDGSETETPELVPEPFLLYNHHKMVNNQYPYEGCYGGKTGYTDKARNTLVTYAKRGDMDLVCVLMDCPSGDDYIYKDTQVALDYCFENYERLTREYNEAQAKLDYPKLALTDWSHPETTPLSAQEGYYPNLAQSMEIYNEYLYNRTAQEALDEAINEKSISAFMEYSRMNHYRPLIIAAVILLAVTIILSLFFVYLARVMKRKRRRKHYEQMKRQRLMDEKKS